MTALLDWEFAHLGDPMDDLAWLAFRGHHVTPDAGDLEAQLARWSQRTELALDPGRVAYDRAFVMLRWLVSCQSALDSGARTLDRSIYFARIGLLDALLPRALAELAGLALPAPEPLPPAEPSDGAEVADALLADLGTVVLPALPPATQPRARCAALRDARGGPGAARRGGERVRARARERRRHVARLARGRGQCSARALADGCAARAQAAREDPRLDPPPLNGDRRVLTPDDDRLHRAASSDPWWSETAWFSFAHPAERLSGCFYPLFRTNQRVCSLAVSVWDHSAHEPWRALYHRAAWHLPLPATDLDRLELGALRYEVLEPLRRHRVTYRDGERDAFLAMSFAPPAPGAGDAQPIVAGFLLRDGEKAALAGGTRRLERDGRNPWPARISIEARDALGRELRATGATENRLANQASPGLFAWMSLTRWDFAGESYGQDQDIWSPDLL